MLKAIVHTISRLIEKPLSPGEYFGDRYEVLRFLGMGSYGYSYLVLDHQLGCEVVLKTLRLHKRLTKKGIKSFQNEINILQSLNHSCFPRFYGRGKHRNIPFYTMEYVNGKTFEELIFEEDKVFSESEAFQKGLELLGLMSVLHQNGIIHRDIRIPNVMEEDGQMKIIDFGLAIVLKDINDIHAKKGQDIRKIHSPLSDYNALGHFLLFLLYSQYEIHGNKKEKSWEEELSISKASKYIIKRLLLTAEPYLHEHELRADLLKVIQTTVRGKKDVVI